MNNSSASDTTASTARMATPTGADLEKSRSEPGPSTDGSTPARLQWMSYRSHDNIPTAHPFVGRIGANQAFVLDPNDPANASILQQEPDAAPGMTLKQQFDLRGFKSISIWKASLIECMGTFLIVFVTAWANISPAELPVEPTPQFGYFANAAYLGPMTGGVINWAMLSLLIFAFGSVSGAHLNPLITMGTFFARLCSLPRATLYILFQTLGGALGGFMVRAGYGSRYWKVGGCWMFSNVVPVKDAFAIEFMASLSLLFIAFGVGLDPRQRATIPASLSPFLVGLALGTLSWATGYARYGYGGASMNPARCFGVYAGSFFPGWHWHQWIAPLCAAVLHSAIYLTIPPGVEP